MTYFVVIINQTWWLLSEFIILNGHFWQETRSKCYKLAKKSLKMWLCLQDTANSSKGEPVAKCSKCNYVTAVCVCLCACAVVVTSKLGCKYYMGHLSQLWMVSKQLVLSWELPLYWLNSYNIVNLKIVNLTQCINSIITLFSHYPNSNMASPLFSYTANFF